MAESSRANSSRPDASKNFTWRCHRAPSAPNSKVTKIWAVNDASFFPLDSDILATAGSDGSFCFWDVAGKSRLKLFPTLEAPVTACAFSSDGKAFAYAVGYDWSMGYAHSTPSAPRYLKVHPVSPDEVAKKGKN
jgi:mRNA export factor